MPMAMFTFIEGYDLSGKMIAPFYTHQCSRLGTSVKDIKNVLPNSTVKESLAANKFTATD